MFLFRLNGSEKMSPAWGSFSGPFGKKTIGSSVPATDGAGVLEMKGEARLEEKRTVRYGRFKGTPGEMKSRSGEVDLSGER